MIKLEKLSKKKLQKVSSHWSVPFSVKRSNQYLKEIKRKKKLIVLYSVLISDKLRVSRNASIRMKLRLRGPRKPHLRKRCRLPNLL